MSLKKQTKPNKGESKQDFLKRCMDGDRNQLPACSASWNKTQLTDYVDNNKVTLTADVGAIETKPESGEFAILAYTGKVVDWGWLGRFIIDLKGMELAQVKVPALLEHCREWRIGVIESCSIDENGFHEIGTFLSNEKAQSVRIDSTDGYPWQASVGLEALRIEELKEGESEVVNGLTVDGPISIWRKASVFETSFCSFGADNDTAAVAMSATAITPQEESMDKSLRKFLESRGLKAEATDQEAWAFLSKNTVTDNELAKAGLKKEDLQKPDEAPVPEAKLIQEAPVMIVELSGTQVLQLTTMGEGLGLSTQEVVTVLKGQTDEKDAQLALYKEAEVKNPPFGAGRIEMGMDERDKFRLAATSGVCARMGVREDKPAAGFEEFQALTLHELARMCLDREGRSTKGRTKRQLAQDIIRLSGSGVSTSDFGSIFMEAAHRVLLRSYTEAPETWRPLVNIVSASDFKNIYGISLSEAPDLDLIGENGEYKTGHLKDNQESYSIGKYGKILSLTMEMIVNDDLRAFSRIPQLLGAAAKRKMADVIYGLLLANPVMNDNKAVFSTGHNNLASTGKAPVSAAGLTAARKSMRKQKGLGGSILDIQPAYLLVPVAQELDAEVILRSTALPDDNKSSGVHNPWAGKLTSIADPRLDENSEKAWYLFASPSQMDTIEVAFLDGNEQPYLEENDEFIRDAVSYKIRHIFGAGWMDHRGVYKNPGM